MVADLQNATRRWSEQLVDLSGRNNLLYFKELRAGTLNLDGAPDDVMNRLLAGATVTLSQLVSGDLNDAAKRARTILSAAQTNFEERGLQTANLALGFAAWDDSTSSATTNAPVLICPVAIVSRGTNSAEYELTIDGEWRVNPTLLFKLRNDFGVTFELEAAPDPDGDGFDVGDAAAVFDEFTRQARNGEPNVPGFRIEPGRVLGNFSFAKQPMVDDLVNASEAFAGHELICALAGDPEARQSLVGRQPTFDENAPDHIEPQHEFLVLDADSSQHYVINAVVSGSSVVVQGPPGTGKSQTITNLIATLIAYGKSVLFVAEKRAAIDAVTSRLDMLGLDPVVMDLHDGAGSRKRIAAELVDTIDTARRVPLRDRSHEDAKLVSHRRKLNDHAAAVNEVRDPWGVSLFELQATLLGVDPHFGATLQLRREVVQSLTAQQVDQFGDVLREWVEAGGPYVQDPAHNPWAAAYGRIVDVDTAASLLRAAGELANRTLPDAFARTRALTSELGLREPATFEQWAALFSFLDEVAAVTATVRPEAVGADLDALLAELSPTGPDGTPKKRRGRAKKAFKAARARAVELVGGDVDADVAHQRLETLRALRTRWAAASSDGGLPRLSPNVADARAHFDAAVRDLRSLGGWVGNPNVASGPIGDVMPPLQALAASSAAMSRMPGLWQLESQLDQAGLGELLRHVRADPRQAPSAAELLRVAWSRAVLEDITFRDQRVSMFEPTEATRRSEEFAASDRDHVEAGAGRVLRAWAERAIAALDNDPLQESLIRQEGVRKRNRLSLRDLFDKAPDVMKALKPCWAMSPLVVSELLPPRPGVFDVVIFDEASQVTPAEAIPALLRGAQSVVAGDSKQLPPTAFFSVTGEVDEEDFDEDDATADMESILDAMSTMLPPPKGSRMLTWHYRSQDERLITFSNVQQSLYRGSMVTFPGVVPDAVRHVLVDATALAGSQESVSDEAEMVVELMRRHAEEYPGESLGVIAMGIKHADRIENLARLRAKEDRVLEKMLNETGPQRLFIKNLERVQGDERDAIILTIGYGKNPDGSLPHRFGPINMKGGERRLNVAITRARRRMTVVSSFGSDDLNPSKLNSEGPQMLRRFLQYAESGGNSVGDEGVVEIGLNPFEIDMMEWMQRRGIPVHPQYGVSGYRIDFALAHPQLEGRMVLAVEADGASYHSSPTARDRDRLRQEHLERLGWRFHRVWSTAWFRDREGETEKIWQAWQLAVAESDREAAEAARREAGGHDEHTADGEATTDAAAEVVTADDDAVPERRLPKPHFHPGQPIIMYRSDTLVEIARWIDSDTLLRSPDQLVDEMMRELGFKRRGQRIVAALQEAVAKARAEI